MSPNDPPRWRSARRRCIFIAGLLLAMGLPGASADASPAGVPTARVVSGASPFTGQSCGVTAPAGFDGYETLPYVAVNPADPKNFTVSWSQDFFRANLVTTSLNGGGSFSTSPVQGISQCTGNAAYQKATHPEVSFGPDGRAYVTSGVNGDAAPTLTPLVCSLLIGCDSLPNSAIYVNTSSDKGRTWSEPVLVYLEAKFPAVLVGPSHIVADPKRFGVAYVTWTEIDGLVGTPLRVARTDDGGATWGAPRTLPVVNAPGRVFTPNDLRVLPDGSLLVLYTEWDFAGETPLPISVWTVRSKDVGLTEDEGLTWSLSTKVADIPDSQVIDPEPDPAGDPNLWSPFQIPRLGVAPDGTMYVAWHGPDEDGPTTQIFVAKGNIDDGAVGGVRWNENELRQVTDSATQAFLPTIDVNSDGTLGLIYYDFRNDVYGDGKLTADAWFRHSHDGGGHWQEDHLAGPSIIYNTPAGKADRIWYPALTGIPGGFLTALLQLNPPGTASGASDIRYAEVKVKP